MHDTDTHRRPTRALPHRPVRPGWRDAFTCRLDGNLGNVKRARDDVGEFLRTRGWPPDTVDRARLVTSELVANAVLHAGTELEVRCTADRATEQVRIEVSDRDRDHLPVRRDPAERSRPGGIGLNLVEGLSAWWGVEVSPYRKVVWCELGVEAGN